MNRHWVEHSQALGFSWGKLRGSGYSQDMQADTQPGLGLSYFIVKVAWLVRRMDRTPESKFPRGLE